jgi:hypothetical protein
MDEFGGELITLLVQGLFFIVGAGFGLVGGGLVLLALLAIVQDLLVRRWPSVPGIIRHTALEERQPSPTMTTHRARVLYDYEVGGRSYSSARLAFSRRGGRKAAEADMRKYPPGKLVHVHYNPRRPQSAVIERRAGLAGTLVLLLPGLMLSAAAAAAIVIALGIGRG